MERDGTRRTFWPSPYAWQLAIAMAMIPGAFVVAVAVRPIVAPYDDWVAGALHIAAVGAIGRVYFRIARSFFLQRTKPRA